jgi:hypothetical protein
VSHLLLMTPAADALVAGWRDEHDWTAAHGIGAHVTVRTPFFGVAVAQEQEIDRAVGSFLPLEVTLSRLEDRPGALVVLAEPDERLWALTHAASAAWPELGPHKDGRPDTAFHVTVVRTPDPALRRAAAEAIGARLPATVLGTELRVAERTPGGGLAWVVVATAEGG